MNKVAAEKIAQEHYAMGVQLALQNSGLVKEAGLPKEIVKKLVQAPVAGMGGLLATIGAAKGLHHIDPSLYHSLSENSHFLGGLMTTGGGAMAGAHLAGKGVDLAHRGGSKTIDALKKLRT